MSIERRLAEVYGVARDVPLTYTTRGYVDDLFINSLARDKHLVVYGGSKQGKTCLRKQCLSVDDYVVVQGGASATREQLYAMVLKEAGATVTVTEATASSGTKKLHVEFKGEAGLPLVAKGAVGGAGDYEHKNEQTITRKHFDIDPADANDVIRVLREIGFSRYIVLEDFHYLSEDVQKEIAFDLKAFHEKSNLSFIIVGVWLENNRLVLYNGDLAGRIIPINADEWKDADLFSVIRAGEPLLNVSFPDDVQSEILVQSQNNVGLLQETCYRLCESAGVFVTRHEHSVVGSVEKVREVMRMIAEEQAVRYRNFINEFIEGFQATELEMYRWIMFAIIAADLPSLKRGLKFGPVFRVINDIHPEKKGELYANNVLQSLNNIGRLQHKKRVQPVILDFSDNVLTVVDSGFLLYLNSQQKSDLMAMINCSKQWQELQEDSAAGDLFEE